MASTARANTHDDDRLDAVFHALADRTRRSLLGRLRRGPASISELASPYAMSLPAVSKHVRVLEHAGLVQRSVEGRVHRCSIDAGPLEDIQAWVEHYREFWEDTLAALAQHVEEESR